MGFRSGGLENRLDLNLFALFVVLKESLNRESQDVGC